MAYCLGLPIGMLVANGLLMFCEMCRRKEIEREKEREHLVYFSRVRQRAGRKKKETTERNESKKERKSERKLRDDS